MAMQNLQIAASGNIFRVARAQWSDIDSNGDGQRSFSLRVKNASGLWVDVVVDRSFGSVSTGHIENGQSGGLTEPLQLYFGRPLKITRWRPGAFGISGNGGGALNFTLPYEAFDAIVELDVIG